MIPQYTFRYATAANPIDADYAFSAGDDRAALRIARALVGVHRVGLVRALLYRGERLVGELLGGERPAQPPATCRPGPRGASARLRGTAS